MPDRTILIVGTHDTKSQELSFLAETVAGQGGGVLRMDVSVLGDPPGPVDLSKREVAAAGGSSIAEAMSCSDENRAMQIMARGAAALAAALCAQGRVHGVLVLGGTMGTDLALDVAAALPLGVPKYIVSTVAFSPLIPPDRLAADTQMILWAGGLHGLNAVCKSTLAQAAGAVLGAARAARPPAPDRPLIGMTGFGRTVLNYTVPLAPALAARGYDLAVFHATGMGGRAFDSLAGQGAFAAVMDFAPQEVGNHLMGSAIGAGDTRMTEAGARGLPQIVAPGCCDLVDFAAAGPVPAPLAGRPVHAHNRLLSSAALSAPQRRAVARALCAKLAPARGPVSFLLPLGGLHEWDRPGAPLHDPPGLAAFAAELRAHCPPGVRLIELDAHINDPAFAAAALDVLDGWRASGVLPD